METARLISERCRKYIMTLSRVKDVDAELAHKIRVRTNAGVTAEQADRIIAALTALSERREAE